MGNNIKRFNEHKVERTFTEKQALSMLIDAVMIDRGDEWIPQEDDDFKSFLKGYGLLDVFNSEWGLDDF